MFDWVAILRGNSVNINFELYPAEAVGEEYNEYIFTLLKKWLRFLTKNQK